MMVTLRNNSVIRWFITKVLAVKKLSLNHAIKTILFNLFDKMRQIAYSRIQDLSTEEKNALIFIF